VLYDIRRRLSDAKPRLACLSGIEASGLRQLDRRAPRRADLTPFADLKVDLG